MERCFMCHKPMDDMNPPDDVDPSVCANCGAEEDAMIEGEA